MDTMTKRVRVARLLAAGLIIAATAGVGGCAAPAAPAAPQTGSPPATSAVVSADRAEGRLVRLAHAKAECAARVRERGPGTADALEGRIAACVDVLAHR